jgi:hypothetical protein
MRFFLGSIFTTVRERFYDSFVRNDRGDLGTASDGSLWSSVRSGIGVLTNKAHATNPSDFPISVQDMPSTDATVTLKNVGPGSGAALWVQSSDDWVTVSVEREDRFVPSEPYTANAQYNYTQVVSGYTTSDNAAGYNYYSIPGNSFSVDVLAGYNTEQNAGTVTPYTNYGPSYGTNAATYGYNSYNYQYTTTEYNTALKFSTYYAYNTAYGFYLASAANYGNIRAYGNFYYKGVTGYYNFTQLYSYNVKYGAGVNYYYTTYAYTANATGTNNSPYYTPGTTYFAGNVATGSGNNYTAGSSYNSPYYTTQPGTNATTFAPYGPNYYYQYFTWTPGFTQVAIGNYQYTAFTAAYTANDQKVVVRQSASGVVNTIRTWLVSSSAVIRALKVKALGGAITVQAFSDANLVSQIGNDLVHTPTGITVDTRFGITLSPATNGQVTSIASEVSIDTE